MKLDQLIKMCLNETRGKVCIGKYKSHTASHSRRGHSSGWKQFVTERYTGPLTCTDSLG
jgi:hypothetical protein